MNIFLQVLDQTGFCEELVMDILFVLFLRCTSVGSQDKRVLDIQVAPLQPEHYKTLQIRNHFVFSSVSSPLI